MTLAERVFTTQAQDTSTVLCYNPIVHRGRLLLEFWAPPLRLLLMTHRARVGSLTFCVVELVMWFCAGSKDF